MSDPFNHPFLQKDQTMYLSTITRKDNPTLQQPTSHYPQRQSSFLRHDIQGALPKTLIPKHQQNSFSLSTYIEPPPHTQATTKTSNPLYIDDIEGSRPKANEFRTRRVVDPLFPQYILPSVSEISVENGRKFLRDTLQISDINGKKSSLPPRERGLDALTAHIEGSQPSHLTKHLDAHSRLHVKDINKDGVFESRRSCNPLNPNYNWRDEDPRVADTVSPFAKTTAPPNINYGNIQGSTPKQLHPFQAGRQTNLVHDIEGTMSNSTFAKAHFIDKRREFRNYMNVNDIEKCTASSLKKGIVTTRQTNPLAPGYNFPGHKQIPK